jgi:peptidyl-prolyl cis-trans isomerase SurA
MKIKQLFLGVLITLNLATYAQKSSKEVLFTINDKPYYNDEFSRIYKKNIDLVKDESQKDLTQYLELYVGYKLKINKANALGLQNNAKYQSELKGYRTQLAKNYFTDSKVTNELVQEGYNRSLKEIKASHILITCDENAAPADTLKAFNLAKDIRQRAVNGEDFGKLAAEFSQDPSAKENKGDLGYFSAFRMVYAFESAAFKTAKGEISNPIRTRFGYHLIKVVDIRNNRGELTVAHIMIMKPASDTKEDKEKAENTIKDIYKKLQQGESFESLAKLYSEDKASAPKGGQLNRFGSGQLSSDEFENTAFSLTKDNPVSAPFQSQFGWHIVKLIEKHPIKTLEEMKSELEEKITKDDRSRLVTASLNEKLKKKYSIKKEAKQYEKVAKVITNDFYENKWELPANIKDFSGNLVSINESQNSGESFLTYVKTQEKAGNTLKPINKLVDKFYNSFVDEKMQTYYGDNLEKEFPEFSNVMDEYRDGLLLFDLMEKEIWEKSKTDTIGLKKFYDLNKSKYNWKTRVDITVASSTNMEMLKKVQKMLKQNKSTEDIKLALNTKDVVNVMASKGTFEEGNNAIPKGTKLENGISEITKDGEYYFISKIEKVTPATNKTLEECKGKAINDYQQFLEENWVSDLKKEYTVKINQDVFEKTKNEIQHK